MQATELTLINFIILWALNITHSLKSSGGAGVDFATFGKSQTSCFSMFPAVLN